MNQMNQQLAGRQVTREMFAIAQNAKRANRRVWIVSADDPPGDDWARGKIPGVGREEDCPNCNGFGYFILDIGAAGPFKDHPGAVIADPESGAVPLSATVHNGAWWRVVRQIYVCPVCSNTRTIVL